MLPARSAFPELIEKSGGGILFPPEDRLALVEAFERLFSDAAQRRQLSISGKKNALKFFSVKRAGQEIIERISELRPTEMYRN